MENVDSKTFDIGQAGELHKLFANPFFIELLGVLSSDMNGKRGKWTLKNLMSYLNLEYGKLYPMITSAARLGIIEKEVSPYDSKPGKKTILFSLPKRELESVITEYGDQTVHIYIGRTATIHQIENISTFFSIICTRVFRNTVTALRSTHVYMPLKRIIEEWKRQGETNLRGTFYKKVVEPMMSLPRELQVLEQTNTPKGNSIVFPSTKRRGRKPNFFRLRYAKIRIHWNKSKLPVNYFLDSNGIVFQKEVPGGFLFG